jgi:hypothetical protein
MEFEHQAAVSEEGVQALLGRQPLAGREQRTPGICSEF